MLTRTFFARAPLAPSQFAPLPLGAISARDDMRDRLIALRSGLLSRCASLFPEAGAESVWFGGTLGGGMHAPNLLEAMLLTGALLSDEELTREALRLCSLVVSSQREDGSFGAQSETFAARGRMLRTLTAAYTMNADKHILTFMLRYMKYLRNMLEVCHLSAEDAAHTADTLEAGLFLYNVTGQKAILPVLTLLERQGADYTSLFHAFPYRSPISRTASAEELLNALSNEDDEGYTHHLVRMASGANLCEGLRTSALCGILTGSGKHMSAPEVGLARLNKAHGAVCGGITADPLLAGTHPSRGVSAVSVCELAASLETLLSCNGGENSADQLESLMYNAVDAFFAPDGHSVQPVQQANQVLLSRAERFPLCGEAANLFSVEDGDALCALMGAWPRFIQHQFLLSRDDGLCVMSYAPCTVRYRLQGATVRLRVSGNYPQGGSIRISVRVSENTAFPLRLRIPAWAKGASAAVDGEILSAATGEFLTLNREWHDGDEIFLTLPMSIKTTTCFHQAVSVTRGPITYVYAPKTTADGLRAENNFAAALVGEQMTADDHGILHVRAAKLPGWGMRGASCDQPPIDLEDIGEAFEAELVPYAKAAIRLAVLPMI